jgi:hypothetical protein
VSRALSRLEIVKVPDVLRGREGTTSHLHAREGSAFLGAQCRHVWPQKERRERRSLVHVRSFSDLHHPDVLGLITFADLAIVSITSLPRIAKPKCPAIPDSLGGCRLMARTSRETSVRLAREGAAAAHRSQSLRQRRPRRLD